MFSQNPFSEQVLMDLNRDMGSFAPHTAVPCPELSAMAEVFPPWFMAIRATAPGRTQDFMVTIRQTLLRAGEERAQADGGWMPTFQER